MPIEVPATWRRRVYLVVAGAGLLGIGFGAGSVVAAQPHMYNALHALERAQSELQSAEADKAGHRVNALRLVNDAIGEVRAGIAAGR